MSTLTKPTKPESKRQIARRVFNRIKRRKSPRRSDFINAMIDEANLSPNGAATYYQDLKTGRCVPKR